MFQRICIIIGAEDSHSSSFLQAVENYRSRFADIHIKLIDEKDKDIALAREALHQGFEIIVAAGGDGTLGNVVHGVMGEPGRKPVVAVMPFGTANDFASAAQLPATPSECLEIILQSEPIMVDVPRINDRYYINVASGGFGAEVTASASPVLKDWLGKFAYTLTGLTSFHNISARPAIVKSPAFEWEGELLGIAVGNGKQAGGGFQICPRAKVTDALLDLTIIPKLDLDSAVDILGDLFSLGQDPRLEQIIYQQVSWVTIEAPEGIHVNVDGQPIKGNHFEVRMNRAALRMILPEDSPLL